MAKVTWKMASEDDPIFSGKFLISSKKSSQESMPLTEPTQRNTAGLEAPQLTSNTGKSKKK